MDPEHTLRGWEASRDKCLPSLGAAFYSYNNSNELTSTSNATYTYDNNGNALTKTDSTGTTTYVWDFENRLTSVTLPGSGGTVAFKYDPLGRRIYKSSSGGTSIFSYSGSRLTESVNASGAVVARYVYGVGIDEPLAVLQSGATNYYEADGLGSVTSLTSSAGAVAQTYTYDSFGKQTASSGSVANPFRYTGREFDTETNLYYYRAGYFDPNTGRFPNEDLIRFGGGINFYAYTRNNPANYTDPLGLCPPNDNPEQISCGTELPDGFTIGSIVSALVNSINDSGQWVDGYYVPPDPASIADQVYNGTNFKNIFQGFTSQWLPNAQSLGDAGNFAYGRGRRETRGAPVGDGDGCGYIRPS